MNMFKSNFWLVVRWVAATVGGVAGIAALSWFSGAFYLAVMSVVGLVPLAAVLGAVVGALQALVLRRRAGGALRWVAWTTLGTSTGLTLAGVLLFRIHDSVLQPVRWPLVLAVAGGMIGLCQWVALRAHARPSMLWVPFSVAGGATVGCAIACVPPDPGSWLWAIPVGVALGATIKGSALARLLPPPAVALAPTSRRRPASIYRSPART